MTPAARAQSSWVAEAGLGRFEAVVAGRQGVLRVGSQASTACDAKPDRENASWADTTDRGYALAQPTAMVGRLEWTWTPRS